MTDITKIDTNDLMAFVYWGKIVKTSFDTIYPPEVTVKNVDSGDEFMVKGRELLEKAYSADTYSNTSKVTKTEAAQVLVSSFNKPFTVVFEKTDGSLRTLRGRLIKPEPLLGRSMVEDLDITSGAPLRQVDHRTIRSIVVDDTMYIVKK